MDTLSVASTSTTPTKPWEITVFYGSSLVPLLAVFSSTVGRDPSHSLSSGCLGLGWRRRSSWTFAQSNQFQRGSSIGFRPDFFGFSQLCFLGAL